MTGITPQSRALPLDQKIVFCEDPTPHFKLNGKAISLNVVRSGRAKSMKLKIRAAGSVDLVLPKRVSLKRGFVFAKAEQAWVAQMLQNMAPPVEFTDGAIFPIWGVPHTICHVPQMRGGVWREAGKLYVSGETAHLPRRVRDWIKREAKAQLAEKVSYFSEKVGVSVGRVTVRDQKSRWGSCSSAGNLNFSWRLLLMPESVMIYIVAHEVAHLRHMNHSKDFWDLVETLYPPFSEANSWLKKNGASLHRYDTTIQGENI